MKKITQIIISFIALAIFVSCQKEQAPSEQTAGVTQFTATIAQTKTSIDGVKVSWCAGDIITVTDASEATAVYVAESAGASTKFNIKEGETPLGEGPYTAAYGDIAEQAYSATGANCPLTAPETNTTNFTFSCPFAILKISATSEKELNINEVTVENDGSILSTLTCSSSVGLLFSQTTDFYIAVEPGTYDCLKITFKAVDGWTASKTRSSAVTLAAGDLLPVTMYFSSENWTCVAAGTMITMWDGSQKLVEELKINDMIRTVDHKSGEVSSAPVCFIWESKNVPNAFTLSFEEGVEVTVVEEHGFYDQEERKYAFINADNAKDYFGHHFYNADSGRWLELKDCKTLDKAVDAYSVVTSRHLDHLANGMLSMCDGEEKILANIFVYDDQMRYDEVKMASDIMEYGLTPLEKVLEYKGFTKSFYYDYNLMYLDVAIGKGLTSWDFVKALSDYYESSQIQ